ncbi:MAG: DUF551 domain-containing protein [Eubacteriales bacterium]|nr:DUF551 domain-containing protein [Eubacteriales bacterium]
MERLTIQDERIEGGWRRAIIDAQAVKEHAMSLYWALKRYEDTGLTPEEIKAMQRRTSWIPVDERLPEDSFNSVLAWDDYRKRCVFAMYFMGQWQLPGNREPIKVLAWMPVPEPEKDE